MNSNLDWQLHDEIPKVWVGDSGQPGPTVTILGGVHGDELGGIKVVEESQDRVNIEAGKVYLALGNIAAMARPGKPGTRATADGLNLNREFKEPSDELLAKDRRNWTPEEWRAQLLLPLLDESDALLDLHDFSDPNGPVFMITEEKGFAVARAIGAPVISSGWSTAEPGGSDAYMQGEGKRKPKVGICFELGYKNMPELVLERGHGAVARFLIANEMVEGNLPPMVAPENVRFIHNDRAFIRMTDDYELYLPEGTRTFDPLEPGQPIARLDGEIIRAEEGQVVIFPTKPSDAKIGTEAFSVGHVYDPKAA